MSMLQNFSEWVFWLSWVEEGRTSSSCGGENRLNTYSSVVQCKYLRHRLFRITGSISELCLCQCGSWSTLRAKRTTCFFSHRKEVDWKVSRKKVSAGKSPLLSSSMSARCLSGNWFITSLGSWEIWQRCPLTVGETGSSKGNKSLPRRHFWPQCRCTSSWGRVSFPFVCWADSSYSCGSQPGSSQTWEKRRDVPAMPERGHKSLMALSSQRQQSFAKSVSRKTMCRSDKVTRLVLFVACVSVIFSPWGREQTATKGRIWYLS